MGDGNCGFRAAAVSMGRPSVDWIDVKREMLQEFDSNPIFKDSKFMENVWGQTYKEARKHLNHLSGPAALPFWMHFPGDGYLLAETFKRPVVLLSATMPCLYLPLNSLPPPKILPICLALLEQQRHIVAFSFKDSLWPSPKIDLCWKYYCNRDGKAWLPSIEKNLKLGLEVLFPPERRSSRIQKIYI